MRIILCTIFVAGALAFASPDQAQAQVIQYTPGYGNPYIGGTWVSSGYDPRYSYTLPSYGVYAPSAGFGVYGGYVSPYANYGYGGGPAYIYGNGNYARPYYGFRHGYYGHGYPYGYRATYYGGPAYGYSSAWGW